MADELPACDVLCEAVEYLSKLGSNLRSRSETLKGKRIKKDKLKNAHAAIKAAQKLLLICELSKKSIENVESGVKKVLSVVDASQASTNDGGKNSTSQSKTKFQYFNFKSRKLRVSKTVPLKHYMSAKVFAKKMPASMQDKYPVFYDCKLYRLRMKKGKIQTAKRSVKLTTRRDSSIYKKTEEIIELDEPDSPLFEPASEQEDRKFPNKDDEKHTNDVPTKMSKVETGDEKNKGRDTDGVQNDIGKSEKENKKEILKSRRVSRIVSSESDSSNAVTETTAISKINNRNEQSGKSLENSKDDNNDSSPEREKRSRKDKEKQKKKLRFVDDSSNSGGETHEAASVIIDLDNEMNDNKPKENKAVDNKVDSLQENGSNSRKSVDSEIDTIKPKDDEKKPQDPADNDKEKVTKEIEEKNDLDSESKKPLIKCVSISKLLKPDVLQKVDEKSNKQTVVCLSSKGQVKVKEIQIKDKLANKKMYHSIQENCTKKRYKKESMIKDEEEFWAQKRIEVQSFKPKKFVISLNRLPTFSVDFLLKHNIKRITKNGSVLFKVNREPDQIENKEPNRTDNCSPFSTAEMNKKLSSKEGTVQPSIIDSVKNALLNDSDSDKSVKENNKSVKPVSDRSQSTDSLNHETENVKNKLLDESDSDKSETREDNQNVERVKDKVVENVTKKPSAASEDDQNKESDVLEQESSELLEKENSDVSEKENSEDSEKKNLSAQQVGLRERCLKTPEKELPADEDCNKIKSTLLNDSLNDNQKTTFSKRKCSLSTTQSKRKHIMESMHAKKMLLTYSSSSETEDEQLNKVIKDIKNSLLKAISSDDDNNSKVHPKRILSSSESDDDLLNCKKKKRKSRSQSKSPTNAAHEETKEVNNSNQSDEEVASSSIKHIDGTIGEQSDSSSSKMGRSREKSGESSSHKSDSHDDKDVDGLTNLKTLTKPGRRRDQSSDKKEEKPKDKKMPKAAIITGEGLLEAPITSDEESVADSEVYEEEDLPAVSLAGLNGSGTGHIAKDDLLGDSDSSSSNENNKNTEDDKKEGDSDTEENVRLKRRRAANAISSDSEAGSSRRKEKDADVRVSDFDDSEADSEPKKNSKRKKKSSGSDASGGSSDEGKKKRRRIKQINDSDASDSDSENDGKKHGRKNIRKVMGKNQLEEATKKAARQEKERVARIAERQKKYNNLEFDESGKPDEVVLDKVVLDFDPETKDPLIEVDRGLVKKLKPHQANGIKFMWDACFESVKRIKKDKGSGCILAHCMGLGKTLQVVSLTHTLLTHSELTSVNRVLVVCPLSTVLNWVNEFKMWLKYADTDFEVDVYELSRYKQNSERAFQLSSWFENGGVCVLGYEMFRNLSADNNKKFKKKMLRNFQEALVDPGPDLVVCDEGHLLKNEKTSLSQSMNRVKTLRRIVLTGTPLQNNLKEYYCMVQFVKPNLLGKYNEYLNRFVNPITNGQYTDSTEHDIRVMKRRSHVLHKMLDGAVQRRDYGVLAPFLPPKHEYVLFITLTEVQTKLYQHYLENYSRRPLAGKSSGFLFPDFQSLQRIWTHPLVLKYNSERYEIMQQKKRDREEEDSEGSLVDFIDDDSTPDESSTEESSDDLSDVSDDSRKKSKKKKASKKNKAKGNPRRGTRANPVEIIDEEDKDIPEALEVKNENPTEWWMQLVAEEELEDLRNSHKLVLLFEILRQCEAIGDKLLVFSQSLYSLDLIEHFLGKVDEATQEGRIDEKLGGHVGSWSPGIDYFRLDGSTSCENRSIWCKNFNREDNLRARLFLISTRAGGLGINLVAANRVVIFDVSWNPSHDVQSIFRVYRFGQKKPCYVYRFLAMGTMEEKIYERQVTKQAISKRVIDEQQIDRHYAENDLAELYKFEPRPPAPRPVPLVPKKDMLFAEMLKEHDALIYKYHEHDSLLENKEEETLSEEERKAAWDDFENEKNKPPPAPFPSPWPMHNGMVPGFLAQQQQQLAYAALASMLGKNTNVSDDQIRSMLPQIYAANPAMFGGYDYGLMQKLSEIYKYPQHAAGMMNPGMMNPVMNHGVGAPGAGMGGGGTSGLQYEPPWQRQQQQQQQMRLQQLMQQQQNSMGAKYYSGGLGSRDPIAMALQQQRAREIMLSDRGRPRGRPPLQPHLPAAAAAAGAGAGDVVNLADSD